MTFTIHPVPAMGAEDVVVTPGGDVITGTEDGSLWRLDPGSGNVDSIAHTQGRPLGIELFPDGDLLVCDAHRGLLRVSVDTGEVVVLADRVAGQPMRFCNNAALAADGTIWFSDSSRHYGIEKWKDDFVQDTRTGRLVRRDVDGTLTVVRDGLAFANGVALAPDESFVAVAETGSRTVVRHWLTGGRAGTSDYLATELPGYPDNISTGSDGLIWVTIASPLDPVVEMLQSAPMLVRKAATRIPAALQPKPKNTIRAVALNTAGDVVEDIDLDESGFHMVTGVREHEGRVWFGSLHEPSVAVVDR